MGLHALSVEFLDMNMLMLAFSGWHDTEYVLNTYIFACFHHLLPSLCLAPPHAIGINNNRHHEHIFILIFRVKLYHPHHENAHPRPRHHH